MKKDLRARVSDYELENYVTQLSNKRIRPEYSKIINRFPNLTEQDFHIDALFDGILETGFWANGSEISNEWWLRNPDFGLDQVKL